jgi:flagellar hook protein FlgE
MSFALTAGVTGLQANQKMLDVAGNNLANLNTTAFKSSTISFAELLSETIKDASQPTDTIGGTNPQQMGSGVGIAGVTRDMSQGNIVTTSNALDLAIEGEGYFVLNDGEQNVFTRIGSFGVDANSALVDPATGYHVQRIGSEGEVDGFQKAGVSDIHIPYDSTLPAKATTRMVISGNLSANGANPTTQLLSSNVTYTVKASGNAAQGTDKISLLEQFNGVFASGQTGKITITGTTKDGTNIAADPTAQVLDADLAYTTGGGAATTGTLISALDQFSGNFGSGETGTITITGTQKDGTAITSSNTLAVDATTSIGDLIDKINGLLTDSTASLDSNGKIVITDNGTGLSQTTLSLGYTASASGTDSLTMPGSFDVTTMGTAGNILEVDTDTTLDDLIAAINSLFPDSTASLTQDGKIQITDKKSGYSKTDINLVYTPSTGGTDTLTMPGYFNIETAGGNEVKNVNITVVDSLGGKHTLNAAFVRSDAPNTWDMVLTSITGDISSLTERRIEGITFSSTGAYNGLEDASETAVFGVKFAQDAGTTQTINVALGTIGNYDGITQFAGSSTAVVNTQNGYEAGRLSSLSVGNDGIIVGAFSNGVKKNIATLQMALFQNAAGLESVGKGYYIASANSGEAVASQALSGGVGTIHGSSLEKSNVDVATEFVNMIEAQNGYQANARTITVATNILSTLTNLIR